MLMLREMRVKDLPPRLVGSRPRDICRVCRQLSPYWRSPDNSFLRPTRAIATIAIPNNVIEAGSGTALDVLNTWALAIEAVRGAEMLIPANEYSTPHH